MGDPANSQRQQLGCLQFLALGVAGIAFVTVVAAAGQTRNLALEVVAVVAGMLLVPVVFVASWFAMIGLIIATL